MNSWTLMTLNHSLSVKDTKQSRSKKSHSEAWGHFLDVDMVEKMIDGYIDYRLEQEEPKRS